MNHRKNAQVGYIPEMQLSTLVTARQVTPKAAVQAVKWKSLLTQVQ